MFGFLKKKIGDFAGKLSKTAEEKLEEEPTQPQEMAPPPEPGPKPQAAEPEPEKEGPGAEKGPTPKPEKPVPPSAPAREKPKPVEKAPATPQPKNREPKQEKKTKPSLATRLKQAVVGEASLSENEIDSFLWEFELALLEADVAQPIAEQICSELKQALMERKFRKGQDIKAEIESAVKQSVESILNVPGFNLVARAKSGEKPCVIMFLGPNGAGKTTTIAKVAKLLGKNGLSSIFAASDTFRAASIEQLEHHGNALNIRVVKHGYGADPAAVAFDAIKSAKAKGIDCVLIDTAGRQETNRNLMAELKKIAKVAEPDFKIYLDEAVAGNALLERVNKFKSEVGVDGIILSKMDLDVKGGGSISVSKATGVPVLYFGMGQSYGDLEEFTPQKIIRRIFG